MNKFSHLLLFIFILNTKSSAQNSCNAKSCQEVMIPNIITANDDGLNDQLHVIFEDCSCSVAHLELFVYNRWGMCVYNEIATTINHAFAWQGECKQGNDLSDGIYYYLIKMKFEINAKESSYQWKGWVKVTR